MKSKSAKRAPLPDLNALEEKRFAQQKQSTLEALTANRANQTNQYGSIDWTRDPTSGAWTQTEKYNPEQQALLDEQIRTQGTLGRHAGQVAGGLDMGYGGAPTMPTVGGYQQEATDTIRALQRPDIERREAADRQRRAAMGLSGGERITEVAERNLGDQASRADMQAILAGMERGDTMFNQGMTARNTYTGEQDRMLKNVGGMMGAAAPEDLQFGSYAQQDTVEAPDYAGVAQNQYQNLQGQYNAKAAAQNQRAGAFNKLLGTAGSMAANYFLPGSGAIVGGMMQGASGAGNNPDEYNWMPRR